MSKRAAWAAVLCTSILSFALIVTFGPGWSIFLALPVAAVAAMAFGCLYARGSGVDLPPPPPKPPEPL